MSGPDLSAIFNRHAFDPWHPHNRERNCLYVLDYAAFQKAVREAIAAKTRKLVDALRPFAGVFVTGSESVVRTQYILEAKRLVAEYDAAQKGPTPCETPCSRS